MSFTPGSWLGEKASDVRVGGRALRSRIPTDHVPGPVLKIGFWALVVLFFLDEFLILAAMVGGPFALVILLGFAATVLFVRRTDRGSRAKRRVTSRVTGTLKTGRSSGYRTRRKRK